MKTKPLPLIEKAAMYCFSMLLLLFYSFGAQAQSPMPDVMVTDDLPGLQVQLSGSKSIDVHDDVIYVVWNDNRNGEADNIYFSKSTDGGLSFTPNTCVYYDEDFSHLWPSVAVNDEGTIFVVWSAPMMTETYPTIWFSRSTDGGQTFDDPLELSSGASAEVFHSLATYGNDVYIFTTGITLDGDDMLADYFFLRSVDGGESFLPAIQVNDQPDVGEEVSIDNTTSMVVDQHGHIYLAWNDGRRAGGNGDIYFAKSTDGGENFGANVRVNAAGSAIEDFEIWRPAVAADGHGNVYVAFAVENTDNDIDEAYLARSADGGASFQPEIAIEGFLSHVNYFDLMAASNGTLAIGLNAYHSPEGWGTWLITYNPDNDAFSAPLALSDVFNHDHRGVQLYYDEEGFAYAVWIDRRYYDDRRLFFARTAEFASAAINPDVFEFEDMFDWFETITEDEIETTITWNDASGVERVYIVIEFKDNGVPVQEVIDLEYRIENDDGVTAQLFMWASLDKGLRDLTKGNSFTMNGYVRFNAGQNAPFSFILLNHPLLAEVYVYDPSTGQGIHEAAVYVQEMDETFMTYHGETMIEFPEPGDYHLNITAQGYLPVVDYKITIVEGVFDHLFDIELMPDDTPPHCDPFELPVFENFSDVAPPDLPECWYANVSLGGGVQTVSHPHYSAPASLLMMKAPEDEPYFISPPLDADLGDVRLTFHARTPFLGFGTPTLEIGTMGDPYDTNTFNYIAHVVVPQSPYQEFSVVFAGYEGDHQHIAFRLSDNFGEQDIDISIDDILIIENLFTLDLLAHPAEGGTVSGGGDYIAGSQVTVSASPNQGFEFQNWRKDGYIIEDVPVFDYTMPAENHTLVAHFIPEGTQTYNLTLEANNPEWGTVTGAGSFVAGETVTVRAIPSAGYVFDHWSDSNGLHETDNPYQFPMPAGDLHLTANFREAVSATINPDTWVFQDFDDFEEGVVTTITWNDAQQVTRVYVVVEDFQYDFYYDVDDIDGITAQLSMYPPAKSLSRNSLFIHGFVEFDVGDPSPITFEFTDPTYYAEVRIREDLYGVGIPNAEIYVQELDITVYTDHNGYAEFRAPAGTYTLDVSAYGFEPLSNQEIELDFDEDYFQFEMTRLDGMFLEVLSSNPAQDDVNVSVFANISIEFDRPIQEGIFGSGFWDIHFEDEYGQFLGFHAVYISDGNILNIDLHHPLEYNTIYYLKIPFYAVADANSPVIFMENNFQLTFRTASDLYPIPLFEDFSGVMPPDLPFGWHKNLNLGGEVATTDMFYYSEPYSLVMMKGPNDEPYFVSPALDANLGDLRVSFFAKTTYQAYGAPTLEIGTMSDPYNTATFHYINHVTVPQDGYHELMVSLHSYEGNHAHIAFRLSNYISNQDVDISIDNILIEEAFFALNLQYNRRRPTRCLLRQDG
ncbi:MAG: Ig-like domain-containing protein, partial [Bacteroidales bacterium]|nr:Ig-like domain-containing protein [Bacteroidales bacterium]